jgi:hypothetical protein
MSSFSDYTKIVFDAFDANTRANDVIQKKQEILTKISEYHNVDPKTFLFVGFNPIIFTLHNKDITVIETDKTVIDKLTKRNIKISNLDKIGNTKFDCVIAMDEYLTFVNNEDDVKNKITFLCSLTKDVLITSIKDYKNQDFKDKEYSIPALIKTDKGTTAYTEIHNWSMTDKSQFNTHLYELSDSDAKFCGKFERRPIYFKQLARFCSDAGSTEFLVHRNLMYKSVIKKNYEHVISVRFDN